jgi:CspA family cold shock protein
MLAAFVHSAADVGVANPELEVCQRLGAIEPVVRERVVANRSGRAPRLSGTAKARRNVAEHVFVPGAAFPELVASAKATQRGGRKLARQLASVAVQTSDLTEAVEAPQVRQDERTVDVPQVDGVESINVEVPQVERCIEVPQVHSDVLVDSEAGSGEAVLFEEQIVEVPGVRVRELIAQYQNLQDQGATQEAVPSVQILPHTRPCSSEAMLSGTMLRWNGEKGFGFIQPSDGGEKVFCHVSGLSDGVGSVLEGDKVNFKITFDERKGKDRAIDVSAR